MRIQGDFLKGVTLEKIPEGWMGGFSRLNWEEPSKQRKQLLKRCGKPEEVK